MKAAVITVSDSSFAKTRADLSGPAVARALQAAGFEVVATEIVPDNRISIENTVIRMCDIADVVVTTGGTGIAPSDVTPEATESVSNRLVPGIAELMRAEGIKKTPYAALSRGVCGIRGTTLIVNLPGNPVAATDSLASVMSLLAHATDLLNGRTEHAMR